MNPQITQMHTGFLIPSNSTGLGDRILIPSNSRGLENRNRVEFEAVNYGECATIGKGRF